MRISRIVALLLFAVALPSALALAQDRTRGTVAGVVEDSTGAVVPNVAVTLVGPFGTRTMQSDDRGAFLFPNLTPGDVTLRAEFTGFRPAEARNVSVRLGEQSFVRLVLQPGEVTQAVEVTATAESPVDTTSTTIGANITDRLVQSVPVQRNLSSMVYVAPGVASGGGTGEQNPSISGASGFENMTVIDGVNITNPEFGAVGSYNRVHGPLGTGINFDFIKEVEVQTGGFEAQYGQALGGVINVVTKSGGNDTHGGLYQYYAPNQLEATRKQPNANLINPRTEFRGTANYDLAGEIGGSLIRDRLFWYGAINPVWTFNDIRAPQSYDMRIRGSFTERQRALNHTVKLTWQPGVSHQLEGSYFADPSRINQGPHVNLARNILQDFREADSLLRFGNRNVVARYNGTFSPHFMLTLSGSRMFNKFDETNFQDVYNIEDIVPTQLGSGGRVFLGGIGFFENTRMTNDQFNAVATANYDFLGKNQTEFGYTLEDVKTDAYAARSGPNWGVFPTAFTRPEDVGRANFGATLRRRLDPVTGQIFYQQLRGSFSPSPPITKTNSRYHAAFAQQNFSPGRRLTLKAGIRWEQQELLGDPRTTGNDPSSHHTFTGNWAPRLGFTIDPDGRNRSKIYGSFGLFFEKIPLDLAVRNLSVESSYLGLRFSQPMLTAGNYLGGGFLSGGEVTQIAPGSKAQYQREFILGVERAVTWHEVKLGVRFVRRDMRRILEDMSGITVEQAISDEPPEQIYVIGNPGSKIDIFHNPVLNPATGGYSGGGLGSDGSADGFADPVRRYWAWEFTADKRWEEVWQMMASYRYSRLSGNYEGLFRNDNLQQDPNVSSLFDFISSPALADQLTVGVLPSDQKHVANFYLAHAFPEYGWNLGIGSRLSSGTPISRFAAHPAYLNAGEIPLGGRGTAGRTSVITNIDVHADYTWNFGDRLRIRPNIDVFNLLNHQHVVNVVQETELAPGAPNLDWGKPRPMSTARSALAYQRPIYVRLALRLEF
jgi:hypothetical protein